MIWNYVIVAFRNLAQHKLYTFINIAGLTTGLICSILIVIFVSDQLSYDRWIPGTSGIYRLEVKINVPGKPSKQSAMTPFVAAQAMLDNLPETQAATRLVQVSTTILRGSRQFTQKVSFVDPNFLQMIKLPLIAGEAAAAFSKPESAILSETAARKYFGDEWPLGKTIVLSVQLCDTEALNCETTRKPVTVMGILRDLPHNTQFAADVLLPNTSAAFPLSRTAPENWFWVDGWSYVRLAPGADPDAVMAKFRSVIDRRVDPMKILNVRKRGSDVLQPYLTPLTDAHLSTDQFLGMTPPGSWSTVYGFSIIGVLILMLACFNFTNLATARATVRAREISMRKVVGATRSQLAIQFLAEALVTAMIALFFALALVEVLLPLFDRILGMPLKFQYFADWKLLLFVIAASVSAGLLSGVYPALVLSKFRPAINLRANQRGLGGSGKVRTVLVVLQFAVSIGLGIAAAVTFAQISFSRTVDLGFRKDAIMIAKINSLSPKTVESLVSALRKNSGIEDVAVSDDVPLSRGHNHMSVQAPGATSTENFILVPANPDYMHLYGVRLLAGRLLSEKRSTDGLPIEQLRAGKPFNVLINASAARRLGFSPQDAIGKNISLVSFLRNTVTIVGVVADIKQDGPKSPVDGTMYMFWPSQVHGDLSVRIRDGHISDVLSFIDKTWRTFAPSVAIERHFLNEDYDRQFQADERQSYLFAIFVSIAIFIACLGLFGLAAFSTERRTKEIGLRKVFGASNGAILWLLLRQFSIPVLIANFVAWPVTWYYLQEWLQGFAFRIALSPLYFVGAGAIALVIAWATILVHALRVAKANPVHALRYE